ncbi:hypothetical protein H0H93_001323 [Arthromyces matolae]|nr:hypothetical protein H0H93_001323 [Arthromyces matolae]
MARLTIRLAQPRPKTIGIFRKGWYETPRNAVFLKFLAPIYRRASKEGKSALFFRLLFPLWFDRFPVVVQNRLDPGGRLRAQGREVQKKFLRKKFFWSGLFHGKNFRSEVYDNWPGLLTVASDRERRRAKYFQHAVRGDYLRGYEYRECIISREERAQTEKSGEELFLLQADWVLRGQLGLEIPPPSGRTEFTPRDVIVVEDDEPTTNPAVPEVIDPVVPEVIVISDDEDDEPTPEVIVISDDEDDNPTPEVIVVSNDEDDEPTEVIVISDNKGGEPTLDRTDPAAREVIVIEDDHDARAFLEPEENNAARASTTDPSQLKPMAYIGAVIASIFCQDCTLNKHTDHPLHRIDNWNGQFFTFSSLKAIGHYIQLGHPSGVSCSNPFLSDLVVLHVNGIHSVLVYFCDCSTALDRPIQLLRSRLFPATTIYPQTAATFELLKSFHLLSFMSKISAFEFYQTLVRLTDNTGVMEIPDRYRVFLRMIREWRHIKLLKRAARGHDAAGVAGTLPGECAVICPACPYPGINLPADWASASPDRQWLYSLFVGIDANFRLKRLKVSNEEHDPGLNHGFSYFVEETSFKNYLNRYGTLIADDVSTCSDHDAIKSASIRGGKGIDASGVGKTECARHDMKRPMSVGDLQKGERYVNMDYFFLSGLAYNPRLRIPPAFELTCPALLPIKPPAAVLPKRIVACYDIVCQWAKLLFNRVLVYPPNMLSAKDTRPDFTFLVPKFHLNAHQSECKVNFSLNFTPNVGRTDGEAPERGWASVNAIASSTKEMGPGSRRDTLDDHFGDYNWRKIITIETTFLTKAKEAIEKREEHQDAFRAFNGALPVDDTNHWLGMVRAWEKDRANVNPFAAKVEKISEAAVRLELAEEEASELRENLTTTIHDDVSPSRLIAQGLELEDHQ